MNADLFAASGSRHAASDASRLATAVAVAPTWVSQAEAIGLLAAYGDKISQPALSQYLKGHPEVVRKQDGRSVLIDWESLRTSRSTRASRGPAEAPAETLILDVEPSPTHGSGKPASVRDPIASDLSARRAQADTTRAEDDARLAKIKADMAEGRVIDRAAAENAFVTAAVALVRAMEEGRVLAVDEIRGAADTRAALAAMQRHERAMRTAFANSLTEFAVASEPALAAAE